MSDPVTNSEVENVLASIRRLVGETKKTSTETPEEKSADRLVLTPQQRVSEPDVLELTAENEIDSAEEWHEYEEPPLVEESASAPTVDETALPEASDVSIEAEVIEEPEHASAEPSEETPDTKVTGQTDGESEDVDQHPPLDDSRPIPAGELSAKIAALETAIARTQDRWDPDGDERDAYAGTSSPAMAWQDGVELDGMGKPIVEASADAPDDTGMSNNAESEDDAQIIDEETLRSMVAEIMQQLLSEQVVADAVRKELQGDLGARISQNIRKLVRREIQLALTAQGLD